MIDTHAHIYLDEFREDLEEVIDRANQVGISKILMPNIDIHSIDSMLEVEGKFPDLCLPMIGLHPCYVKEDFEDQLTVIASWLEKREFMAVGEIGTDLYWDKSFWDEQKKSFHYQCELAIKYDLPIVIHCRESIDETISLVEEYDGKLRGVFHCFTGTRDQADRITNLGFYLGLGGVTTFKNSGMGEVVPYLNASKIILETDSPYLAPTPNRGKRNEPSFVSLVAEKVSEFLNMEKSELIELTDQNARNLFSIHNTPSH